MSTQTPATRLTWLVKPLTPPCPEYPHLRRKVRREKKPRICLGSPNSGVPQIDASGLLDGFRLTQQAFARSHPPAPITIILQLHRLRFANVTRIVRWKPAVFTRIGLFKGFAGPAQVLLLRGSFTACPAHIDFLCGFLSRVFTLCSSFLGRCPFYGFCRHASSSPIKVSGYLT